MFSRLAVYWSPSHSLAHTQLFLHTGYLLATLPKWLHLATALQILETPESLQVSWYLWGNRDDGSAGGPVYGGDGAARAAATSAVIEKTLEIYGEAFWLVDERWLKGKDDGVRERPGISDSDKAWLENPE
ncbi:hypothetical protein F5Y19DRAFT_481203 [Xylariaceae sp. FL1651]|nr:hypothetical protein F5Y19DRAFT_481203 [Xylariaceae sp. FL1651]